MHCTCHKKSCRITCFGSKQLQQFEQRVLQTGSNEGGLQWQREGQQPHFTRYKVHGARGLESTVAHGFVKHGFKVLLHRVVDGLLQASRCLVSRTPCVYTRYTLYPSDKYELPVPRLRTALQVQDRPAEPLPYPQIRGTDNIILETEGPP